MPDAVAVFHSRYADYFGRREARCHSERYLRGLLAAADARRSAATIAESGGPATPRALQRFLSESTWPVGPLIAAVQRDLGAILSTPDGVFVLGEVGFPKQGDKSVGVQRQPCGPLGDVTNCQVGVFLAYASERGQALVDARLYLPREWIEDDERRRTAGIPPEIGYRTREEMGAQAPARRTRSARLPNARGDGAGDARPRPAAWQPHRRLARERRSYAQSPTLRRALDAEGLRYLLEVPRTTRVFSAPKPSATSLRYPSGAPTVGCLTASGWEEVTLTQPSGTLATCRFAVRPVQDSKEAEPGLDRWLIVRRDSAGGDPRYYLSNAAPPTPLATIGRVAALREATAPLLRGGRGEIGLGEYEVRGWQGWHHHIALAILGSAFLAQARAR